MTDAIKRTVGAKAVLPQEIFQVSILVTGKSKSQSLDTLAKIYSLFEGVRGVRITSNYACREEEALVEDETSAKPTGV